MELESMNFTFFIIPSLLSNSVKSELRSKRKAEQKNMTALKVCFSVFLKEFNLITMKFFQSPGIDRD